MIAQPMRRKLLNFLTLLSLILCLAVAWTWAHPQSSGGVPRNIAEIRAGGRAINLSEVGMSKVGGCLMLATMPRDFWDIGDGTPAAGMTSQRYVRGIRGMI